MFLNAVFGESDVQKVNIWDKDCDEISGRTSWCSNNAFTSEANIKDSAVSV